MTGEAVDVIYGFLKDKWNIMGSVVADLLLNTHLKMSLGDL